MFLDVLDYSKYSDANISIFFNEIFTIFCFLSEKAKFENSKSSKIKRSRPILTKFSIKHHPVFVHSHTKLQLDKSKFAWVWQFWEGSQKIENMKKFEQLSLFWPNSIPQVLDQYIIFVCSFRTIAQILRKLELPRPFFKKLKSHKITNRASIVMKMVTIKGSWLLHWCTKF